MADSKTHYESHLADFYSWISGGFDKKLQESRSFFEFHLIAPHSTKKALDLGSGPGFQSIALAQAGFEVTAVDQSEKLLKELENNKGSAAIATVCEDISRYVEKSPSDFELCVCMGDTLTHLADFNVLISFIKTIQKLLVKDGIFVVTFRDLSEPITELDRVIPVRSDENTIFTCFLEPEKGEYVRVYDLIYRKSSEGWTLYKSFYRKLKIAKSWLLAKLKENGLNVYYQTDTRGFVTLMAKKV